MAENKEKHCPRCLKDKNLSCFYQTRMAGKVYHQRQCMSCVKEIKSIDYQEFKEKRKAQLEERKNRPPAVSALERSIAEKQRNADSPWFMQYMDGIDRGIEIAKGEGI